MNAWETGDAPVVAGVGIFHGLNRTTATGTLFPKDTRIIALQTIEFRVDFELGGRPHEGIFPGPFAMYLSSDSRRACCAASSFGSGGSTMFSTSLKATDIQP